MAAESAPPSAQAAPTPLGLRLSIMMFLQWAMFGLWVPVAGRFLRAGVADGGLGFSDAQVGWIIGISGSIGALLAPFLGGFGGWVLDDATDMPTLDTPEMVGALQFMSDLVLKHKIVPPGCDYDTADVLFKEGKAAMLINGDWSLGSYAAIEIGLA